MSANPTKSFGGFIAFLVFGVMALILMFSSFGTIAAGQAGVKTRLGPVVKVMEPGFYMKTPFIESVHKMSVKTLTIRMENTEDGRLSLASASKDLQDVSIGVVVNYHIDATKVGNIYQQYNSVANFESNVIEPAIRKIIKETSAQYTAEELVTKRAEFASAVNKTLAENFTTKDAVLEEVNITNLEFSSSFTKAIEEKVTAEQSALAAKNKLEQIKFEAEQTVVTAKAEAEAQTIKARALESSGGKQVVELEAIKVQRAAVEKWNGVLPTQMIPGSTVPFINLTK